MRQDEDLIASEERRSYAAVFVFAAGLLLACTVWAIWQDTFSRHEWKQHKVDFYEQSISRYEDRLAAERARLAADPDYVKLTTELSESRAALTNGDSAERLAALRNELRTAKVHLDETDLDLRVVRGKLEEAWYWYDKALEDGVDPTTPRRILDGLERELEARQHAYDEAVATHDEIRTRIDRVRGRVEEIEESLRPYYEKIDRLQAKLDAVSWSILGHRVVRVPMLEQTVLRGFERNNFGEWVDRVDRCRNCHAAIDKDGFDDLPNPLKTHPDKAYYLGKHDPRHFGCTPCHGGQGASINSVAQAHGTVEYWEDPLLDVRDKIQSRCVKCHGSAEGLKGASVAARGEQIFRELGCHGCHLVEGFESLPKAGPSLEKIAAKTSPEWLVEWIADPAAFRPRTRMPTFFLSRDEAKAITAYLLAASLDASREWLEGHPAPSLPVEGKAGHVAAGRVLTESLGCLGCHGFEPDQAASSIAVGVDTAPNLSRIADKTNARWIYNWILDTRGYSTTARMPRLRLDGDEATNVTTYLMTLGRGSGLPRNEALRREIASPDRIERGKGLIRRYGCFGCHVIPGMEKESRVSVELSTLGSKPVEELFFGSRTDLPNTWDAWTENKIRTPRTYATERVVQNMPQFGLGKADVRALTVFLASKTRATIARSYLPPRTVRIARLEQGRRLVGYYNCNGCHAFDGHDAAIRRYFGDDPENAPPILVGEGAKLQPEWFFDFLMRPVTLRPWLKVRMPTFGFDEREATVIVDYFAALAGRDARSVIIATDTGGKTPPGKGQRSLDGAFDCFACHPAEGKHRVAASSVSQRPLSNAEIERWLADNLGIQSSEKTNSESEQAEALRAYLE